MDPCLTLLVNCLDGLMDMARHCTLVRQGVDPSKVCAASMQETCVMGEANHYLTDTVTLL